jgi:hypothetical protein
MPRSGGVSMRCRNSWGRMSPTRWVAASVWPLRRQSKQVTPRLGAWARRSSVWLNCCGGERGHQQPQALQLFGVQNAVKELATVHQGHRFALGYVPQVRAGGEKEGGGNSGRKWSGKSKSRSKRVRSRPSRFFIPSWGNGGKHRSAHPLKQLVSPLPRVSFHAGYLNLGRVNRPGGEQATGPAQRTPRTIVRKRFSLCHNLTQDFRVRIAK